MNFKLFFSENICAPKKIKAAFAKQPIFNIHLFTDLNRRLMKTI